VAPPSHILRQPHGGYEDEGGPVRRGTTLRHLYLECNIPPVLNLFQVLYWFIRVDAREPSTSPYKKPSIQGYNLQSKHYIETSPAREVKMLNQSSHRMRGSPTAMNRRRDSEGGAVSWGHLKRAKANDMMGW